MKPGFFGCRDAHTESFCYLHRVGACFSASSRIYTVAKQLRAAIYVRVSTDGQDTENQRQVLEEVAARRGWTVVEVYEDAGISGAKGRDKRPGFDAALKAATRRRYDVLMVWSIDRMGRSTATVATARAGAEARRGRHLRRQGRHGRDHAARNGDAANGGRVRRAGARHDRRARQRRHRPRQGRNARAATGERARRRSDGRRWPGASRTPSGSGWRLERAS